MSIENLSSGLLKIDPWLEPYADVIHQRGVRFREKLAEYGPLKNFATTHQRLGLHQDAHGWIFREWAPRASALALTGSFCDWSRQAHPLRRLPGNGIWEIRLPADALTAGDLYKIHVIGANGAHDRLPSHASFLIQDNKTHDFAAQVIGGTRYQWKNSPPGRLRAPRIYEAHIGMATEQERVGSYREFADEILPRISRLGYNAVQLMAIAEHPYYGSFGYHVSNYFAPSSRFGSPDDLRYLVDQAHGLGLAVLMDLVHSHSVKNLTEGLAALDGQEGLYFHSRQHPQWDSRLFNYGSKEVCQFLLSNLAYWMDEFRFDGFRFDGVTSMLYHHHGEVSFNHYDHYFGEEVDIDALSYLQLANELIHEKNPHAITIAEDMSGMPGLCRPLSEGGLGFDYRLAMGIPDYWIKLLKHSPDEHWNVHEIYHTLTDRRPGEKTISYTESHDQALVGDKTLAFRLMDAAMYEHMRRGDEHPEIARGMALHKILRLLTLALGGQAYLNFMGNEFGHPEWVDFPREGNGWSYQHARRQWSLADNGELKYQELQEFDTALLRLAVDLLPSADSQLLNLDQENQCLQFERAGLVFAINLSPHKSIADNQFPILPVAQKPNDSPEEGEYRLILSSDDLCYGGYDRLDPSTIYPISEGCLRVYLPSRTALVFAKM